MPGGGHEPLPWCMYFHNVQVGERETETSNTLHAVG
jgi:hypothetical protein